MDQKGLMLKGILEYHNYNFNLNLFYDLLLLIHWIFTTFLKFHQVMTDWLDSVAGVINFYIQYTLNQINRCLKN